MLFFDVASSGFFPHRTLLRHWPKIYSPAPSSLDCLPSYQQEAHWVPSAPIGDQVLSLPHGKPDGSVWHSGLSNFPAPKLLCPTDGRCVCSSHLLHSSLHGPNPEQVLTILGGGASVVAPMDRTTPPKEDKVGTSSAEAPTAHALVTQPKSEVLDDNLGGDAPNLLNAAVVGSKIACRTSSRLQMCWSDSRKLDCPVWDSGWSDFHAP
jgi:hypothetical protein